MSERGRHPSRLSNACDSLPLPWMRNTGLRLASLFDRQHECSPMPDGERSTTRTHLHRFACKPLLPWQPIEDTIVREIAIPGYFAIFGGKALPSKVLGQRQEVLFGQPVNR